MAGVDFQVAPDQPFTTGPTVHLASADLNHDNLPDLVAVGDGNVRVFLGDGEGGFTASDSEALGGAGWTAIGQLNGDSNPDIALTGNTGGVPSVRFLFGNGSGGFSFASGSSVQLTGATSQSAIAVGYVNSDSIADIVGLGGDAGGNDKVYVLLGNGSGLYFQAPGSPYSTGTLSGTSIAAGSLNGGSNDDVATSALSGVGPAFNYMSSMLGGSSGALSPASGSPFSAGGSDARVVVIADFDGDGKNDLAASNEHADNVGVLLGNGTGAFAQAPSSPFTVGANPYGLAVGDVNNDSRQDLLVGNDDDNNLDVLTGDGSGEFTRASAGPFSMGTVVNATSVVAGDFNGDQLTDAVVATANGPVLMLNDTISPSPPSLTGSSPASPANENAPRIVGTAPAGTTVDLYASANCQGAPVVDDATAAALASPGLLVSVPDDASSTFSARASDAEGGSPCSLPFTYTEDSTGPTTAPTVSGLDPDGPANDNTPEVFGSAPAAASVRLYTSSSCLGPVVGSGTAAEFATSGVPASVPDDSITTIYARSQDGPGNPSSCSSTSATYVEDSTPPPAPVLTDTDPEPPANQNLIRVKGTAPAGATVRLYANATCAGGALAAGSGASFASPGIAAVVGDESETTFHATATDSSGIPSECSTTSVDYVEDSTAPETLLDVLLRKRARFARFDFSSEDPTATFGCSIDGKAFGRCDSPLALHRLRPGRHLFRVRAIDAAGNGDITPAERAFRIRRRPR